MKTFPGDISIQDYTYSLPDERIALHPLAERDQSKLLVYKDGDIQESRFVNLPAYLPENSLLVCNNTKVINARLHFKKTTGSTIEIFCLEPAGEITEYSTVMNQKGCSTWKCFIGGAAKWKSDVLVKQIIVRNVVIQLYARMIEKQSNAYLVSFEWEPSQYSFAEIIEYAGDIPLPPYIKRTTAPTDTERYQTIYAAHSGSVAAPTAGLHFTQSVLDRLVSKNVHTTNITLHVGAGTFKPVTSSTMEQHEMHAEWIEIEKTLIEQLIQHDGYIVATGTTSVRTLESLYWLGVKAFISPHAEALSIQQWDAYSPELRQFNLSTKAALQSLLKWLEVKKKTSLFTQTQLLIAPGYAFKMVQAMITNFHQPHSTLLLLVAAAVGKDWKSIYEYALENDFRFLSYGDSSLLFMAES